VTSRRAYARCTGARARKGSSARMERREVGFVGKNCIPAGYAEEAKSWVKMRSAQVGISVSLAWVKFTSGSCTW